MLFARMVLDGFDSFVLGVHLFDELTVRLLAFGFVSHELSYSATP